MAKSHRRGAFTLVELLVVIAIIGILVALLLPAIQAAREAARRSQCTNNLKQLGVALHNYHDTNKTLPFRCGGTSPGDPNGNGNRLSGYIGMLPFMEQGPLYEQIVAGGPPTHTGGTQDFPPFGPVPWNGNYSPWLQRIPGLLCPSDPGHQLLLTGVQPANYCFSTGDVAPRADWTQSRGPFTYRNTFNFSAITDGLSNTIAMAERCVGIGSTTIKGGIYQNLGDIGGGAVPPINCMTKKGPDGITYVTGGTYGNFTAKRWTDGAIGFSVFNTIIPPNGPTCQNGTWDGEPTFGPPTSYHPGGCLAVLCDGSVSFFQDTIDTGNLAVNHNVNLTGPSPYGVWGSLGSRNGGEGVQVK
jgi:prepilin-type N-terminal cleavage/methylation domain-containing protein